MSPALSADSALKDMPHVRRAVSFAWIAPGKLFAVGNQTSGSISIIDRATRTVIEEIAVGQRLTDLKFHRTTGWLLATDDKLHELIVLERSGNSLVVKNRLAVSPYPMSVAITNSCRRVSVASLWSRKITVFGLLSSDSGAEELKRIVEIPLGFNPQVNFFMASEDYLTIRDAFTRQYAGVSIGDWISGKATQPVKAPPPSSGHDYGRGSRLEISKITDGIEYYFYDGGRIALGPAPEPTPAERGEGLFFDRTLSGDKRTSCDSCHAQGHSTYQLADTLGDDTTGTPKRIPTLLGTRLTDPWAWNGKQRDLSEQVRKSLETTMHAKAFTQQQVGDLVAYLHTLEPPPPLEPATDDSNDKEKLIRGEALFQNLSCGKCHVPPLTFTSPDAYDVGLIDEQGLAKFNPPSLRGVSQGYTFFHDGRARSLEDVFTVHGHMLDRAVSDNELSDLLRYLRSL